MARQHHRLTPELVASLEEPRLHADGDGLYLRNDADGSRRWSFIYHSQRRREMSFGSLRDVDLLEARRRAEIVRISVRARFDPIADRKAAAMAAWRLGAGRRRVQQAERSERPLWVEVGP